MKNKKIIGIDLGGTNLKIALLDSKFKILDKQILSTQNFIKKQELIDAIINSCLLVIKKNKLSKKDLLGIGVGLPGPIDTEKGLVHFFPNIPGWKEVRLQALLAKKLGVCVFIDNDANVMALAEARVGAAKKAKNAVCLTLGTGVGGALILNGKLFRGSGFAAGEIGHMPINEEGPDCNCGGRACLETYVGNNKILALAKKDFGADITLEKLSELAYAGDKKAISIWENVATKLGVAISSVVNLINPDMVVIGGGVANAGKIIFDQIRKTVDQRAMSVHSKTVKITKAILGNDAGMIGAGLLVKEELK